MEFKKYSCNKCGSIPTENILKCINNHIYCPGCIENGKKKCYKCSERLVQDKNEAFKELFKTVNSPCKFKERGCTWTFPSAKELNEHIKECKYQPYDCIGQTLGLWKCSWKNSKYEVENHLLQSHNNIIIKAYTYQEESSVYFNAKWFKSGFQQIRLIQAFNKTFIFLYEIDIKQKLIFIIIFLLGRKQDALKYIYNFTIISSKDKSLKIKFTLPCFSDTDDIRARMQGGDCVCLPFNVAKAYFDNENNALSFFFRMSKKETTAE